MMVREENGNDPGISDVYIVQFFSVEVLYSWKFITETALGGASHIANMYFCY